MTKRDKILKYLILSAIIILLIGDLYIFVIGPFILGDTLPSPAGYGRIIIVNLIVFSSSGWYMRTLRKIREKEQQEEIDKLKKFFEDAGFEVKVTKTKED